MLESKNKVLAGLVSSLKHNDGIDTSEFESKMAELNNRFYIVTQHATTWEQVKNKI
jgi:hypothetical protein